MGKYLYYGIQKLRGGVAPAMVRRASELLDSSWSRVKRYIERRLENNYGLEELSGFEWLDNRRVKNKGYYRGRSGVDARAVLSARRQIRRTSGSSGEPLVFQRDATMTAWMDAAMWAVYSWYGIGPGDQMARFWGRPLSDGDTVKRRIADTLLNQRRMDGFNVTAEKSRAYYRGLRKWGPDYAYGYPTLIQEFVEHLQAHGEDGRELGLDVVITTGELLNDSTRKSLEQFFGCPVANEYGCSESGILAFECPAGRSHLIPVAAFAEVIGDTRDRPSVREGEVLVTDLFGDVTPFIRYSLNDHARRHPPVECECGRELPELKIQSGRTDAFIRTPHGRKIYDAILAYSVPDGVAQFQVRQTAVDELRGRIVVQEGYDEEKVRESSKQRWQDAVGGEMTIKVKTVERIDRPESGKWRYFIPLEGTEGDEAGSRSA